MRVLRKIDFGGRRLCRLNDVSEFGNGPEEAEVGQFGWTNGAIHADRYAGGAPNFAATMQKACIVSNDLTVCKLKNQCFLIKSGITK